MTFATGDAVWVRPVVGSKDWRRGVIRRMSIQPEDYEVEVEGDHATDCMWYYNAELRPCSAVDLLARLLAVPR